jgi:hypothetical protein
VKRPGSIMCECGDHAFAALTRGRVTLVSPEDAGLLAQRWYAHVVKGGVYAAHEEGEMHITLHGSIMGAGLFDHRNGDGTDNRRPNLRPATNSQNAMNRRARGGPKGVWFEKDRGKWRAQIVVAGRVMWRERFDTEAAASDAYRVKSLQHHGVFSREAAS